jgi:hypothetical protein
MAAAATGLAVLSGGQGVAAAPQKTYVSHKVGVAVTIPVNWKVALWTKGAGVGLNIGRPAVNSAPAKARLVTRLSIGVLGTTKLTDARQVARVFVQRQIRGLKGLAIRQQSVHYAGTPGIMLLGMPGVRPTVQIVLAYKSIVYGITAPGKALEADQKAVLRSLRFV